MDEENTCDKVDSTEEAEERSDSETECLFKEDSDSPSQSEQVRDLTCSHCKINFTTHDEVDKHKLQFHPLIIYKCVVDNCPRWFPSRKTRDKHSENLRSRLHKVCNVKSPPPYAIFIENASTEQLEIVKNYANNVNKGKGKRGPKPKFLSDETEKNFLVGLPKDQLKRKLMESVVEQMESSPNKKSSPRNDSSPSSTGPSKRCSSIDQLSHSSSTTIPNVASPKPQGSKSTTAKIVDPEVKLPPVVSVPKPKPIPNFSHLKVPLLPLDNESFNLTKFSKDLISLLINYDVAEYFKYPLIDHYAPGSSQLGDQIDMETIKRRLKQGLYSNDLLSLRTDLLKLYSNGIYSFNENSVGWQESAKLYQTALANIQNVEKKQGTSNQGSKDSKLTNSSESSGKVVNTSENDSWSTYLNILNPYNNGKLGDNERIMSIGEQTGKLKSPTQYLNNFKEDRRNKIAILSYLDYGPNFSFGPCYDSGNAYCTKEVSDLLIRGYGDQMDQEEEEEQYRDLNEIIPEPGLGDDFSLYLMNVFTRDILKSCQEEEKDVVVKDQEDTTRSVNDVENDRNVSRIQQLLNDNSEDLKQLKFLNYQRLANHQMLPSIDEFSFADKVINNLTSLISEITPESVMERSSIRKALDLVL